jgi:cation diffusion facilitator CzcD-associated flavoprotein CzcO
MSLHTPESSEAPAEAARTDVDAVVIGAGFGGLRMLHELREQGLSTRVIEAGTDVGGTWYWNRYPGARTDTEAWAYAFSFSKELQDEWDWTERFPTQPEALGYLRFAADRLDMRRDIEFRTRVESAVFDEASGTWRVTTDRGDTYRCTYLITAAGVLSAPYRPDFPGLEDFRGEWHLTGHWPHEPVDFAGKKVAVIGTGATAVQLIPIVAHTAAEVTVFQRTPNYVLPARSYTISEDERRAIRAEYDEIWARAKEHFFAFPWSPSGRLMSDHGPEDVRKVLEGGWEAGGFRYIFETFDDILVDPAANDTAAEFIRDKIRTIVRDPETAELLCPKDYPLAGKRPPLGHFYYETFNRENVRLVDVSEEPISRITADGVQVGDREYEADVIVFATGFDAVTGALVNLDIQGRDGVTLREKWAEGPRTHLGIAVDGFPNMFMICGPQSPFANIPVVIDGIAEWIGGAITRLREGDGGTMEATPEAVESWRGHIEDLVNATVLPRGKRSWFLGGNIPGKPQVVLFYFGGAGLYRKECQEAADRGFDGFAITGT